MVGDALCGVSFTEFKDVRSEFDAVASRLRCKAIPSSLAGDDHENTSSSLVTCRTGSSPFVTGGFKFEPEPLRYVLDLHFRFECGEINIGGHRDPPHQASSRERLSTRSPAARSIWPP
jgi:hypothetical protein